MRAYSMYTMLNEQRAAIHDTLKERGSVLEVNDVILNKMTTITIVSCAGTFHSIK